MTPEEFIFEYLKADQDTGAGSYEKMVSLAKGIDWEQVKSYILKLRYFYFLKTSYWMIISAEVKRRAGWKCACGKREGLQVHHTEEANIHHGEEHLFMSNLVCLCGDCHRKLHPVATIKANEKKRQRNQRKESLLSQLPFYPNTVSEETLSGSSIGLTRKLLEELEQERKIVINRTMYEGWKIHRCT